MLLLRFGMPDPDFSLAGVDFKMLTEISPARAKGRSEGRDATSDSSPKGSPTQSSEDVDVRSFAAEPGEHAVRSPDAREGLNL